MDRIDSPTAEIKIMQSAGKKITPPAEVPLEENDMPFFDAVVSEFARSEWTDHSLQLAAMLARMMSDMQKEQALLRTEGSVAYSEKGTPVVSPRKTVVQMYAGSILSMRRSLSLHARAQGGDTRDIAKRNKMAKAIEARIPDDDDLIPRINN